MTNSIEYHLADIMYEQAEALRSKAFELRKAVCTHPQNARYIEEPNDWTSWPDYGTDPGQIRCLDCNTLIGKNYGDYRARKGVKSNEDD